MISSQNKDMITKMFPNQDWLFKHLAQNKIKVKFDLIFYLRLTQQLGIIS